MIVSFPQRDPQWAALKISPSNLTIGRFGCTITAIASMTAGFGLNLTPPEVLANFEFTDEGLIIWRTCVLNDIRWVKTANFASCFDYNNANDWLAGR